MQRLLPLNVSKWIDENKADFKPPVCNKCMYSDQLKAFLVGGPNIRKDFHLEEGEEFFYMVQGDMCLRAVEKGRVKDIHIKQGYTYMQPERVLHSPQRYADTVGLVVERSRAKWEYDSLRYFVDENTLDPLFERWFYMTDAVADLPPIIHEYENPVTYFDSQAYKTGKPTEGSTVKSRPFEADPDVYFDEPINLHSWLESNKAEIDKVGFKQLYGPPRFKSVVNVYGKGVQKLESKPGEVFIWHFKGHGKVTFKGEHYQLDAVSTILVPAQSEFVISNEDDGYCFTIYMPTPASVNNA